MNLGQRPNIKTKYALSAIVTQEMTRVSGPLCQEPRAGTNIYFILSHFSTCNFFLQGLSEIINPKAKCSALTHTFMASSHPPIIKPLTIFSIKIQLSQINNPKA